MIITAELPVWTATKGCVRAAPPECFMQGNAQNRVLQASTAIPRYARPVQKRARPALGRCSAIPAPLDSCTKALVTRSAPPVP